MSLLLHILAQDIRRQRWEIAVAVTMVALGACEIDPRLDFLLPIPWLFLLGRQDADWRTRPISPGLLLAARLLFAAFFIHGVSFCARAGVLARHGFDVRTEIRTLLLWELGVACTFTLPALVLASLTRNRIIFIQGSVLLLFLGLQFRFSDSALLPLLFGVIAAGSIAALMWVRHPGGVAVAGTVFLSTGIAALGLLMLTPADAIHAFECRGVPGTRVELRYADQYAPAPAHLFDGQGIAAIPVDALSSPPTQVRLLNGAVTLPVDRHRMKRWEQLDDGQVLIHVQNAQPTTADNYVIVKSEPARGTVWAELDRVANSSLTLDGKWRTIPGVGHCRATSREVNCESAHAMPGWLSVQTASADGRLQGTGSARLGPKSWWSPLYTSGNGFGEVAYVDLVYQQPLGCMTVPYNFRNVDLNRWRIGGTPR